VKIVSRFLFCAEVKLHDWSLLESAGKQIGEQRL
jgi:hypothetical protein